MSILAVVKTEDISIIVLSNYETIKSSIADGSCFVAHEYCLVDAISSVLEMLP
jgi:hypothetical protein